MNIDLTFGETSEFLIIEVLDDGSFSVIERRQVTIANGVKDEHCQKSGSGCSGGGCHGGAGRRTEVVKNIADCRCVICKKIGVNIQKQLEKKAIVSFDVECSIEEALGKIIPYFYRVDHHMSLRGI